MDQETLFQLLQAVQRSDLSVEEALGQLRQLPFAALDEATLDHHRAMRRGFPEVIFGAYKTPQQVAELFDQLAAQHELVLCTRATPEHVAAVVARRDDAHYDPRARCLYRAPPNIANRGRGEICVVCAGTADLPVASEALLTATLMGNQTRLITDVGVAGLHRLLAHLPTLSQAEVLIVVAGMEGALPSVVAGLLDRPVIAVPTSVGYGASQGGWAALFGMLSSCAAGITVANIDNGFGAAYAAALTNRRREATPQPASIAIPQAPQS